MRHRIGALVAILTMAVLGVVSSTAVAQASGTGYNNTDPYATSCSATASPIHRFYPPGGGVFVMYYSNACGTNWIQWEGGFTICTWKRVQSPYGSWTQWEKDFAPWSYSMQIYAPGNTPVDVEWAVGSYAYGGGTCAAGAWDYAHEVGKHGWYTVT